MITEIDKYHECVDSFFDMIPPLSALIANEITSQFRRVVDDDGLVYKDGDELKLSNRIESFFWNDPGFTFQTMIEVCDLEPFEFVKIVWLKNQAIVVEHVLNVLKDNQWKLELI